MKKRLVSFVSAFVLSIASLSVLPLSQAFAAAPYTCTWTGGGDGTSFSDASNWSGCNGAAPQPGDNDNLIFDNSDLSSSPTLNNDVAGLDIGNITFSGSSSRYFTITGDAITLDDGVTETGTASSILELDIALNGDQTFNTVSSGIVIGDQTGATTYTLALGSSNLTFSGNNSIIYSALTGSGTVKSYSSSYTDFAVASPSFSGSVQVNNGYVDLYASDGLGTADITIANGAALSINSQDTTEAVANNITVSGTGVAGQGAILSCLYEGSSCTNGQNTTLTFSGTITLAGDTQIANGAYPPANTATINFTGPINYNGYTLTAAANKGSTIVNLPSAGSSGGSASGSSSSKKAPKTPDTGMALVADHSSISSIGAVMLAGGVYLAYRKVKFASKRR